MRNSKAAVAEHAGQWEIEAEGSWYLRVGEPWQGFEQRSDMI